MSNLLPTGVWIALAVMILLSAFLLMFDYWRRAKQRPALEAPRFAARPILTREEAKIFHQVEVRLPLGHRVLTKFPYAEMLEGGVQDKYHAINTQSADLVIIDAGFNVVAVINYRQIEQTDATERDFERATMREVQKMLALEEAGLPLLRIPAKPTIVDRPSLNLPANYNNPAIEDVLKLVLTQRRAVS